MAIHYRYYGILSDGDTPDDPSGVLRTWTDQDGRTLEEVFRRSLQWERSMRLALSTRPDDHDYVEIDESVVERFIERVTKNITEGRYRYFGMVFGDLTPDDPATVIRVRTDPDGQQREETFKRSLKWEPSHEFSPMARPNFYELVEIDESVVERFVKSRKEFAANRDSPNS